jgi:putative NADH-flavin reductase
VNHKEAEEMRITVFGAAGNVGRRVLDEALMRGHEVTAVIRNPAYMDNLPAAAIARVGDAANIDDVIAISSDQDVVINAIRSATSDEQEVIHTTSTMMDGIARTGVRLLVIGGAASLTVPGAGGRTVLDDPRFIHPAARPVGQASLAQLQVCLAEMRVNWTYLSPPARLVDGDRTGEYRLGRDELLLDMDRDSTISIEDLAVVLLDEVENPRHSRMRFTAAY